MDTIYIHILHCLEKQPCTPTELAEMLHISRQTVHKYLRVLVAEKKIVRHGKAPHVQYSVAIQTMDAKRVFKDYELCRNTLLPTYLKKYSRSFRQRLKHCGDAKKMTTAGMADLAFLLDAAAVYSSNIEGNTLDLSSFLNSRMSPKRHRPKEAQEIEDLVSAYSFARKNDFDEKNVLHTHRILSREFVAPSRQGQYRKEPVGVFSHDGLVYMAVEPYLVAGEMHDLFTIVTRLTHEKQAPAERLFWASWLHLMIALIHPFSDGNGRTARLSEKWFLASTLGEQCFALPTEKQYWLQRSEYYACLKLGVNYWEVDMKKAVPFFDLLPQALLQREKMQ